MAADSKRLIRGAASIVAIACLLFTGGLKAGSPGGLKAGIPGGLKASGYYRMGPAASVRLPVVEGPVAEGPVAGDLQVSGKLAAGGPQATGVTSPAPQRIVSLVPALTEMLFAIGAGPQVIAVSSYDDFPSEVQALPKVGALLDPDTERILSLRPDLVITYGSQRELEAQFARAGIRTFSYRHGGVATILETLRDLGTATGRAAGAERAAGEIQAQLDAVRERVRGRPRPRTALVFDRQPQSLQQMYVSGGVGFLHEMLEIAGGTNAFADVRREAVQPSHELMLVRAPEVILEVRANGRLDAAAQQRERAVWTSLGSVPAVRNGRIHFLSGEHLVIPGPRIGLGTEAIARALHPEAFQ